jgi:hypothetical protein
LPFDEMTLQSNDAPGAETPGASNARGAPTPPTDKTPNAFYQ